VYDFLSIYFEDHGIAITNFVVSTNFPKRRLEDMTMTVDDAVRV